MSGVNNASEYIYNLKCAVYDLRALDNAIKDLSSDLSSGIRLATALSNLPIERDRLTSTIPIYKEADEFLKIVNGTLKIKKVSPV